MTKAEKPFQLWLKRVLASEPYNGSQSELANVIGVHKNVISGFITGSRPISERTVYLVASKTGAPLPEGMVKPIMTVDDTPEIIRLRAIVADQKKAELSIREELKQLKEMVEKLTGEKLR